MNVTVEQLLDEFVGRWTRDEPLAVDELLVRAGPQADELAGLIDRSSSERRDESRRRTRSPTSAPSTIRRSCARARRSG